MNAPRKARNSFGIPFLRTGPENMKNVLNQVIAALDSVRCQPSADIDPLVTAEGTLNRLRQPLTSGSRRAASSFIHPFQVGIVDVSNPAAPTAAISYSSRLYPGIALGGAMNIVDLTAPFALTSNTCVWIQVTVASNLTVSIASRQTGTSWPLPVVTSGTPAVQTSFNVAVGRVMSIDSNDATRPGFTFSISGTPYRFEQCLFTHLLVENRGYGVTPILYAFPWGGAA